MKLRQHGIIVFGLLLASNSNAIAQSAPQEFRWERPGLFEPASTTARAITGPIEISGTGEWGEGSRMTISFDGGASIPVKSVGASWRVWDVASREKVSAELFKIEHDPGVLVNGNTICGGAGERVRYLAIFEDHSFGMTSLGMAAFSSVEPPFDIDSSGLCGTFSYVVD